MMTTTLSTEVRKLKRKWDGGNSWPKYLEWIQVEGIRGWKSQRIRFDFPIVAIVGENGSGKSTLLQSAACAYKNTGPRGAYFPTEFFPETTWDSITSASIKYSYRQGPNHSEGNIRKPTSRWLGQPDRPERAIEYIDLSRLQPVGTRVGYARIAKNKHEEQSAQSFSGDQLSRLSEILGKHYDAAKIAKTSIDKNRQVPVLQKMNVLYSGFHQGSGETTIAELLQAELPKYGLILIDEIESSLHPRAQRRLVRDLAEQCRIQECQIIITTHPPYILEELPLEARICILDDPSGKEIVSGVSPQFAMTRMDDERHPECELYVEDKTAEILLNEILIKHGPNLFMRCIIIPYGSANLGMALGQMSQAQRFNRPTCVFLDGDMDEAPGCITLPGEDAPEIEVFSRLKNNNWGELWTRIGRDISKVHDACSNAMLLADHHDWVTNAASHLMTGGDILWQAMCAEYAQKINPNEVQNILDAIEVSLNEC